MDSLMAWFDLNGPGGSFRVASEAEIPLLQQVLLYAIVVAGVLLSEAVAMARRGGPIELHLSWSWVAVACVIALVVFPAVWHELAVTGDASLLVQAGLAAQGGVFWGVLVAGAEKQTSSG